jgi:glycogen operon protein
MRMEPGQAMPLGATLDQEGCNFALFSEHGTAVELCLYDPSGERELARHWLAERTGDVWHGYLPGVEAGLCYGYRVHGPYEPEAGHRFNHHKLLLDPYARQLRGTYRHHASCYGYDSDSEDKDLSFDRRDNADCVPKAVVTADSTDVHGIDHPRTSWASTVIYEAHVRGFSRLNEALPQPLRGTFAGLAESVDYFKSLGISAVELMPVQGFINEPFLTKKGLSNYWGYSTLAFFAPHRSYMNSADIMEFRRMVDKFHDAGIEVILDVVYNHTCEVDELGPTLSFRGIDNASYYQLQIDEPRYYVNHSGCGNSLNIQHPHVLQMVMDSLRYWAGTMGVDGFRFDLASSLGRGSEGFDPHSTFFQAIAQDPLLSRLKMIAEPWDLGPHGYQLGHYPQPWSEWNDRYRDSVRRFWHGEGGEMPELAKRLHGSSDIYEAGHRRPHSSINFVTSHDGFTLHDLVSYDHKHNQANGEDNRDGHHHNLSANHGVEGDTNDEKVNCLRRRQQRNFLATLMMSQGVPMLLAGDERGHSQGGNNNAYCQDNEITWLDWNLDQHQQKQLAFTQRLLRIRRSIPLLLADRYRHGPGELAADENITWVNANGEHMQDHHWHQQDAGLLGYLLTQTHQTKRQWLVILNAEEKARAFRLPTSPSGCWWVLADTEKDSGESISESHDSATVIELTAKSVRIFSSQPEHTDTEVQ